MFGELEASVQRGRQAHPVFLFTTQHIEPEATPRSDRARPQLDFDLSQSPLPVLLHTRTLSSRHHPHANHQRRRDCRQCAVKMAPASVRRPPYKDFLQPALHRRFSTTALILLAIAYVYAIGLARWNSCKLPWQIGYLYSSHPNLPHAQAINHDALHLVLWSWFPIGPTGIRAAFLWFSGSLILILRIAQYHPGYRTSDSAYDTFLKHYRNFSTLETIVTYVFSAWLFAQVYLFSRPKDSGLEWVTYLSYDRQRLNEKAVAFTTHFAILGAYMAIRHLWLDTDRLLLGVAKPSEAAVQNNSSDVGTLMKKFWGEMPTIFSQSLHETVASAILTFVIYPLFLRKAVWRLSLFFFRPFFNLPKTNYVPYSWPVSFSSLISMVLASIMLLIVWIAGNTAFTMFMVKEPTKDQRPFTSGSKDPNGSLLNGLKHKKLFYRVCFLCRPRCHVPNC